MLFSEIYSLYFNALAEVISMAQTKKLDSDMLFNIVKNRAFPESAANMIPPLKNGDWPIIKADYSTNIKHKPQMPLSLLQKEWLKSMLNDSRIRLFLSDEKIAELSDRLKNVQPLFEKDYIYRYDIYADGDDFEDPLYRERFRFILAALHQRNSLFISYRNKDGIRKRFVCIPIKIEFSEKDNKFRLLVRNENKTFILNFSRINEVKFSEKKLDENKTFASEKIKSVTVEIYNQRKAMERVLIAFAHFEKSTEKISSETYRMILKYDGQDETEVVIRLLSFGPMVKVVEPDFFVGLIKNRLKKQLAWNPEMFSH